MFAPTLITQLQQIGDKKKVATLKTSMCGCPCMAKRSSNISRDDVEKDVKYVFSAIAFYSSLGVAVE